MSSHREVNFLRNTNQLWLGAKNNLLLVQKNYNSSQVVECAPVRHSERINQQHSKRISYTIRTNNN